MGVLRVLNLNFSAQFLVGDDDYDVGVTDLEIVVDQNGQTILVGLARGSGGVFAWKLSDPNGPAVESLRSSGDGFASPIGATLITLEQPDGTGLIVAGLEENGVQTSETNGFGGVRPLRDVEGLGSNFTTGVQLSDGSIALADTAGSGFSVYTQTSNTTMTLDATINDTNATHASAISAMASFGDVLIVGSSGEFGISSYTTTSTTPSHAATFGPESGLGIMVPTAISTVGIDGQGFALVASAGGASGALTVFGIGTNGSLTPTDHAMDSLLSRFGSVQDIATQPFGDGALVVAGGGDDGLTIMALMPNGRLVHLASFEDTQTLALSGVTALHLTISGDEATIYASTQGDAGVSIMTIDLSDIGAWNIATASVLSGTANDDILMTGAAATTLDGGAGNDVFVITEDGDVDHRIVDFDPTQDRINLSDWSFLYDADSLSIQTVSNGVIIAHRGESLLVTGVSNGPLNADDVRAAIDLDVTRLPTIPNAMIQGDNTDETLSGNWANDTVMGEAGNDTLLGDGGDDMLYGGGGGDTLIGGAGDDTVMGGSGVDLADIDSATFEILAHDAATNMVQIMSDDGTDTFYEVENFNIGGATFSFEDLAPLLEIFGTDGDDNLSASDTATTLVGRDGDDTIIGGAAGDLIKGGTGDDLIIAGGGNDDILAGQGNDTLYGGAGNDTLNGAMGNDIIDGGDGVDTYVANLNLGRMFVLNFDDTSVTLQSSLGVDVISNVEFFQFDDQTISFADLIDPTARGVITGTEGFDQITDEGGSNAIYANGGDDAVRAGNGRDYVEGGLGEDRIWGGASPDELYGGVGDDRVQGEAGNDMVYGGDGNDLLRGQGNSDLMSGGNGNDILYGGAGLDLLLGDDGNDYISGGALDDQLWGGLGDDDLRGGDDDDILWGGAGADALRGGENDDDLYGGGGNDVLLGGAGRDTLTGGTGNDTLTGGGDPDTFIFDDNMGTDTITDYNEARDIMVLDAALVGAALSGQDVVDQYAFENSSGVVLDLEDGNRIILEGLTLLDDIAGSITIG